ncbi:ANTAR domain-containing protein [Streptomyces sp. NBC_00582]|uniref:ANTAR domain-containing protein n=1 Tax=Streptomyces sp. NBC_00582 TaxID=2975783 RepID=UPI0010641CE8|nr:ANTAR domain-containing protein [Streptomyces sp. NBC_00582]WUB67255.1 ANTAR domain-containing protein [Streptomyces sp. NBC_00582]
MGFAHNGRPEPTGVRQPQEPDDLAATIVDLQRDNDQLQTAVTSHAVIDQAVGVVIALGGLRPQQGFCVLTEVSQHTNIKLREIAALLVDWVSGQQLPDDVQRALNAALKRARDDSSDCGR